MIKKRGGERHFELDGETWAWRLAGMDLLIRRPDDKKVLVALTTVIRNSDHYSIQRDMEKRNFRFEPGLARDFVKLNRDELLAMKANGRA